MLLRAERTKESARKSERDVVFLGTAVNETPTLPPLLLRCYCAAGVAVLLDIFVRLPSIFVAVIGFLKNGVELLLAKNEQFGTPRITVF